MDRKHGIDIQSLELSGVADGILEEGSAPRQQAGCRLFHFYNYADDLFNVDTTDSCLSSYCNLFPHIITKRSNYFAKLVSTLDVFKYISRCFE